MNPPPFRERQRPSAAPMALARSVAKHRHLLAQLILRDIAGRYQGSFVGLFWSLITPLLMLGVYVFVFGFVFNPLRGAVVPGNMTAFALSLFTGMLTHTLLAECLVRSTGAVLSQPGYVKKVVFPVELLPLTVVGSACVQYAIGLGVLMAVTAAVQGLSIAVLLWPLVILPLVLLCAGVALATSALAVYLRDIAQVTGLVATVLMFLSPVFYPVEQLPAPMRSWMQLNPLTVPIESARALLLKGVQPDWSAWALHSFECLVVLWLGWAVFQSVRKGFADVI
jgi:lipopolysaccharide transport system permease protein